MSTYRLASHGYELTVDAVHGASLTSLRWRMPDGGWFELLHPCPPAEVARTGGCFVMAPFANRLDAGRFAAENGEVRIPLNRPEQDMAIHGFSRDRVWRVEQAGENALTLIDDFAAADNPFAYELAQQISIGETGVDLSLVLTNRADRPLPYGMGYHPWFHKEEETRLTLAPGTWFGRDERGLPTGPLPPSQAPDFGSGLDLSTMPWFDAHFAGWTSRQAVLDWRRRGVRLILSAGGALTNLHVYVPDTLPVCCVEPVSHVPDVHNRRDLADYGDIALLPPGRSIEGAMKLECSRFSDLRLAGS
jgi:aldose 1-epimerase